MSFDLPPLINLPWCVCIVSLSKEDGGVPQSGIAAIPLLKACQSDGQTPDEAMKSLREAQEAWLTSALKHGDPVPVPQ